MAAPVLELVVPELAQVLVLAELEPVALEFAGTGFWKRRKIAMTGILRMEMDAHRLAWLRVAAPVLELELVVPEPVLVALALAGPGVG